MERYSPTQLSAVCTRLPAVGPGWRWSHTDWLALPLPARVARAVRRGGGIGIDDQVFDVPPLGYSLIAAPALARYLHPWLTAASRATDGPARGSHVSELSPVRCPSRMGPAGLVTIVVAVSAKDAPGIYHLFAFWDSTADHPALGAIARSRDLAQARAFVTAFDHARIVRAW